MAAGWSKAGPSQGLKIWGGHIVLGGDNMPSLVEIGLTDLQKSGEARVPPRLRRAWYIKGKLRMYIMNALKSIDHILTN